MAEEKKSPNLKDRLKKSQAAQSAAAGAPVAPPGAAIAPPVMPPVSAMGMEGGEVIQPPSGNAALPGIPGIPGFGGDVAPPAFVTKQKAVDAAVAKARAAAADPFASAAAGSAAPQSLVIHMDNKEVHDHEVGRSNSGTFVAVGITAVVALAAGYAVGGMVTTKGQEHQTLTAVAAVRTEVVRLGDVINQIKEHVDHAVEAGNITIQRGEGGGEAAPAAPPTHPPDVDEPLIEWFRGQPPEPPFSPDVYAGRVGRLRSAVVGKITLVTLQFTNAWQLLGQHVSRTNAANVRTAIAAANPQTNDMSHMLVTFGRSAADAPPFAMLVLQGGAPAANAAIPITGAGIAPGQTRQPYPGGDIVAANLTNLVFPVAPGQGLAAQALAAAVIPWRQYQARISELKTLVDALVQNHSQLLEALQGGGAH